MGLSGIEPLTSRLSGERSNRLSYRPIMFLNIRGANKMSRAKPTAAKLLPHNINPKGHKGLKATHLTFLTVFLKTTSSAEKFILDLHDFLK
jgi:hypothetical protein